MFSHTFPDPLIDERLSICLGNSYCGADNGRIDEESANSSPHTGQRIGESYNKAPSVRTHLRLKSGNSRIKVVGICLSRR